MKTPPLSFPVTHADDSTEFLQERKKGLLEKIAWFKYPEDARWYAAYRRRKRRQEAGGK